MLITVELLLADNLRRSLLTLGELDLSPLPGLERVIECYTEKICHHSSRNVVQALSGPALADPQPAGAGFFFCSFAAGGIYRKSDVFWKTMSGSFLLHGSLSRKRAVMYGYISLKTGDSVTTGHFTGCKMAR